ncbi:MAG: flagellar biosynthetic protein FliR [Treponema sp.]|nr:flagellar biosynthetic protein FliR [Treponema sp.]
MPEGILRNAPVYLLSAARCFALIMTLPLFSSQTVNRKVKIALAGFLAAFISPQLSLYSGSFSAYGPFITPEGNFNLVFILLLLGEGMIGVIIGFYIQIIFAVFSTAGQFFAFQMGFSASSTYDSLSQVENPLLGQFLNFSAMLVFLQQKFFQKIFITGIKNSFDTLNAFSIVNHTDSLFTFMTGSLVKLFADAFVVALPIMGTLFLINVMMGVISKAVPQMNLLSETFPIMILTGFFIMLSLFPQLVSLFTNSFSSGFKSLQKLFMMLHDGGIP